MIKAGIAGGCSLGAGELVRLLVNHPDVELKWVHSSDKCGHRLTDVHPGLIGETDMVFTDKIDFTDIDILFLCLQRGDGRRFVERNELPEKLRVVDLSGDFRADSDSGFVYGLPELNRKELVRGATRASVPGALATAVNLALLPLARHLMLNSGIHVTAICGRDGDDCGAGEQPAVALPEFYAPLAHKQIAEISDTLRREQTSFASDISVVAMRGQYPRGLAAMIYFDSPVPAQTVIPLYREFYDDHNFTFISDRRPSLGEVAGTNKCVLHIESTGSRLVITSVLDNILKGGVGQAVHIMNLLFGLQECVGLRLKAM